MLRIVGLELFLGCLNFEGVNSMFIETELFYDRISTLGFNGLLENVELPVIFS